MLKASIMLRNFLKRLFSKVLSACMEMSAFVLQCTYREVTVVTLVVSLAVRRVIMFLWDRNIAAKSERSQKPQDLLSKEH